MSRETTDGLFVGNYNITKEGYIRALELPDDASWVDICNEQNRRYFASQENQHTD